MSESIGPPPGVPGGDGLASVNDLLGAIVTTPWVVEAITGPKGEPGADGQDGADGVPGEPGADGIVFGDYDGQPVDPESTIYSPLQYVDENGDLQPLTLDLLKGPAGAGGGITDEQAAQFLTVEEPFSSRPIPAMTAAGGARTFLIFNAMAACKLVSASVSIPSAGPGYSTTDYWTVGIRKAMPAGNPGTPAKQVRIVEKTTVAVTAALNNMPANAGERLYPLRAWDLALANWYFADPDDPADVIPPNLFQPLDVAAVTFTPSTANAGDWPDGGVFSYRTEPYEDVS